ncbi:hypothetical protein OSTOST_25636, partial [Ostertagia ostertagi]
VRSKTAPAASARGRRTVVTAALIFGTFLVGWTPASILFLLTADGMPLFRKSGVLINVLSIVVLINIMIKSLTNPIIYATSTIPSVEEVDAVYMRGVVGPRQATGRSRSLRVVMGLRAAKALPMTAKARPTINICGHLIPKVKTGEKMTAGKQKLRFLGPHPLAKFIVNTRNSALRPSSSAVAYRSTTRERSVRDDSSKKVETKLLRSSVLPESL